jgi:hypothetical protein
MKIDRKDKYGFIVLINANLHHLIVVSFSFYTLIYMCDRPFILLYVDEICLRTYRPFYSHTAMFTIGYFLFDLII